MLAELKGKEELIGDIIALLQSPIKNVIGALQGSGGQKIAGLREGARRTATSLNKTKRVTHSPLPQYNVSNNPEKWQTSKPLATSSSASP